MIFDPSELKIKEIVEQFRGKSGELAFSVPTAYRWLSERNQFSRSRVQAEAERLFEVECLSCKQISKQLKVPLPTVYMWRNKSEWKRDSVLKRTRHRISELLKIRRKKKIHLDELETLGNLYCNLLERNETP